MVRETTEIVLPGSPWGTGAIRTLPEKGSGGLKCGDLSTRLPLVGLVAVEFFLSSHFLFSVVAFGELLRFFFYSFFQIRFCYPSPASYINIIKMIMEDNEVMFIH